MEHTMTPVVVDRSFFQRMIRALEDHGAFLGVVKNELGFTRPAADITGHRSGASAAACDRIILNYPDDPFSLIEAARKVERA